MKKTNFGYFIIGGKKVLNTTPTLLACSNLDDYAVVPCEPVSPAHLIVTLKKNSPDIGVVLLQTGGHLSVLRYQAEHCFFKLTLAQLQKLSQHLGAHQPNPDIASHLRVLIKKVITDISDDKVEEILKMRSIRAVDPMDGLIPEEMEDEILDKDDQIIYKD